MAAPNVNIIYRLPNLKEIRPILFGWTVSFIITIIVASFYSQEISEGRIYILFLPLSFITGFLFGWGFGYLYNMFLVWSVKLFFRSRKTKNILFGYELGQSMQVIKSPNANEEVTLPKILHERKIYKSNIDPRQRDPYTIAFIASPYYMGFDQNNLPKPFKDPILDDEKLFYSSVGRALLSLGSDEVLGHPDIWSRIRIITIFPNLPANHIALDYTFVGESSFVYGEQLVGADDIVSPISPADQFIRNNQPVPQRLINNFRRLLANQFNLNLRQRRMFYDTDVIYFMTANPLYIRSSARPSEGQIDRPPGNSFKVYDILNPNQQHQHEKYSKIPGLIALNVIYARQKTFIHEFAHAMSHEDNGAICDEYYDIENKSAIFTINSKRKPQIAVPKEFLKYFPYQGNAIQYQSDRDHPSTEENWHNYFPQREAKYIGCTMDRTIGHYQFDKLLVLLSMTG